MVMELPPARTLSPIHRAAVQRELEMEVLRASARNRHKIRPTFHRGRGLAIGIATAVLAATGGVAAAATTGGWFNSSGIPVAKPPPMKPEQLPNGSYDGHPLSVPSGPQDSVADCPQDPKWSPPLPAGAKVSVSLESGGAIQVNGGNWQSTVGYCAYTVTIPGQSSSGITRIG
jgi:hypothetical protein